MINIDDSLAGTLGEELGAVQVIFERQLHGEHDEINRLCDHLETYRGKMLRPSLVLLCGIAVKGEGITESHRTIAAVVEMIHMATLVHDDVLDEAEIRRSGRTVNDLHGNEMAVMLGDYLISKSFHLCSQIHDPWINLSLGEVTNTLCEGELIQLSHRNDMEIDESRYFTIVQKKTASLIGASCRLGAHLSGADKDTCAHMERFGVASGVAFQITDDVLDLVGEQDVVGKSVGKDLDKGKLTLPIIYALSGADGKTRDSLIEVIRERDLDQLRIELDGCGSIERAMQSASLLVDQAKRELCCLPASPARELLASLADGILDRRF